MNLSTITQLQLAQTTDPKSAAKPPSTATDRAVDAGRKRVQQAVESAQVQLSAFGQISSSFATAQTAAQTLTAVAARPASAASDIRNAVKGFVAAYNAAVTTVSTATRQGSPLSGQAQVALARTGVNAAVTTGQGLTDLRQIGVSRNQDGTLNLDTAALERALQDNSTQVRSALADVGRQVASRLGSELSSGGNVGTGLTTATQRVERLTAQQTAQEERIKSAQQSQQQATQTLTGGATGYAQALGLAAYKALFGA